MQVIEGEKFLQNIYWRVCKQDVKIQGHPINIYTDDIVFAKQYVQIGLKAHEIVECLWRNPN